MKLEAIRLSNWKAFAQFELAWDEEALTHDVAVIEGANGYGKTSLQEAIPLCLYGREGIALAARALDTRSSAGSYDTFLERARHDGAAGSQEPTWVELSFINAEGEPLVIRRIWHFSASGSHRRDDEEVRIWLGKDEDLLSYPDDADERSFIRDFVAQHILPRRLAAFFLFDGEHLERLAGENLELQVRRGVEAAYGVDLFRLLGDDLRQLARSRRQLATTEGTDLDGVANAIDELETRAAALRSNRDDSLSKLEPLRAERDRLVARIGGLHGESYANFKGLFEKREQLVRQRDALQEELRRKLSSDFALALAGKALREKAIKSLEDDEALERLSTLKSVGMEHFEVFEANFGTRLQTATLEREGLFGDLRKLLKSAWDATWEESAKEQRALAHAHLGVSERPMVARRLAEIEKIAGESLASLTGQIVEADEALAVVDNEIASQKGTDELSQSLADELGEIQRELAQLEDATRNEANELDKVRAELKDRRDAWETARAQSAAAQPLLDRAHFADRVARAVEAYADRLVPLRMEQVGAAISEAYVEMAHKTDIARIEIGEAGEVHLLDHEGRELSTRDRSAGENQIFALAVMSAITAVSQPFPIIMDTPLARLDPEHRKNVLLHFAKKGRQVIFLSHPAELSSRYLELIEPQIGQIDRLDHVAGRSRALPLERSASAAAM